ncbi:unnamed protein product, partial [Meganyctiphanes norvegica]
MSKTWLMFFTPCSKLLLILSLSLVSCIKLHVQHEKRMRPVMSLNPFSPRKSLPTKVSPSNRHPPPMCKKTQQRMPKSRSHHNSLSRSLGPPPHRTDNRRHRSLDRVSPRTSGAASRETFRTPQPPRRSIGGGAASAHGGIAPSLPPPPPTPAPSAAGRGSVSTVHPPPPFRNHTSAPGTDISYGILAVNVKRLSGLNSCLTHQFKSKKCRSSDNLNLSMSSAGVRTAKPTTSSFSAHLEPFPKPQEGLKNALVQINHSDWENQVKGIQDIVRVIKNHPEILQNQIHDVNMALLKQAKNLRSQVSRAAIQALTWGFDELGRAMEYDAEKITAVLLHRTGDTNKFLQLDCNHSLDAMIENIAANKAIPAISNEGINHINTKVRTTCARLLAYEVELLGPDKVLSGSKDITERILHGGVKLAQEGSLETRKYAKQIFQPLVQHPQFDKAIKKHVSQSDVKNVQKFLDSLQEEPRTGVMDSARSKYGSGARFNRTM